MHSRSDPEAIRHQVERYASKYQNGVIIRAAALDAGLSRPQLDW